MTKKRKTDMKRFSIIAAQTLLLALLLAACGGGSKQPKASKYQEWKESLTDSLTAVHAEMEATNASIDSLHAAVERLLPDFDYVNNPREVEGYTIYRGWKGRYPLSATGLVARMSENTAFELVATLRGGTFDRIVVSCEGENAASDTVPYDRALNYRADGLNTVAFSGRRADAIGAFIAAHQGAAITVDYYGTRLAGKLTLPADQATMIARTWELVDAHHHAKVLEHKLGLLQAKSRILERKIDK